MDVIGLEKLSVVKVGRAIFQLQVFEDKVG